MGANQTVTVFGKYPTPFIQESIKEHKKSIYGLSFPLGLERKKGGFFSKKTGLALIKDAVKQLLLTETGERILLPNFGCNLRKYLFQPLDEDTFESIKDEIVFSFERYIVGAKILKLSVTPYGEIGPAGGNSLKVKLLLQLLEEDLSVFDVEVELK